MKKIKKQLKEDTDLKEKFNKNNVYSQRNITEPQKRYIDIASKLKEVLEDKKLYIVLPIMLLLAIVPIIVYLNVIPLKGIAFQAWPIADQNVDFFSYSKRTFLYFFTTIAFICFVIKARLDRTIIKSIYYIPLLIYVFFIFLSTLLSIFPEIAYNGVADRYEGFLVLICYAILPIIVINVVSRKRDLKLVLSGLSISAIIIFVIGIFQYIGFDFFQTRIGKIMILPLKHHNLVDTLKFNFGKYTIYSTLYNTNFVGSYSVLILSVSLLLYFYSKKNLSKWFWFVLFSMSYFNLVGSLSRAGMLGTIFAGIVLLIVNIKNIFNYINNFLVIIFKGNQNNLNKKEITEKTSKLINIFISILIITVFMTSFSKMSTKNSITNRIKIKESKITLEDIKMTKLETKIIAGDETIKIYYVDDKYYFKDLKDNIIDYETNFKNEVLFKKEKYKSYSMTVVNKYQLDISMPGLSFIILNTENGFKIAGFKNKLQDIKEVKRVKFLDGKEKLGSARAYIWSRTIPLLKHTVIFGYGPDTFSLLFPQDDVVGKLKGYGTVNKFVDKPHNMYLQLGVNTGVISMIVVILMFLYYFVSSFKLYFNKSNLNIFAATGLGCFVGISGYLISGLFNDSLISVAPVFWILFGLGIICNRKYKEELNDEKNNEIKIGESKIID